MKPIPEKPKQALYKSIVLFMLDHVGDQRSTIDLYNAYCDQTHQYVDDPEWVAWIVSAMDHFRQKDPAIMREFAKLDGFIKE